ncbi:MAG: glycosyltransferase family 2 protein [Candidatus Brocadiae bacterium]|nr:glycosyltransferase family 2 protein [Candidatus Brocadiia bacterium]
MNDQKLVSVVIPVYNREKYLAQAIQSVLNQKGNISRNIIIIDDGSTDKSAEIAKSFGDCITYIYQKQSGISAARNAGVMASQGELIAFLDSDDLWMENKLLLQAQALDSDPSLDVIFGHIQQFISPELPDEAKAKLVCDATITQGYHASTMLIKKQSFLKVGFFDLGLRAGEFIDWYNRAKNLGLKSCMLQDLLAMRRLHDTNYGILERKVYSDYFKMLKKAMERKK